MSKSKAATRAALWRAAREVRLLREAHEAVGKVMPAPDAAPEAWREFYRGSTEVYARVAEIDRAHHHEALYWANREREKGEEIARSLAARSSGGGEAG